MASQVYGASPSRRMGALAALFAGTAVVVGAFGAHALSEQLTADQLATLKTATRYQMWHSLAVIMLALSDVRGALFVVAARLLLVGVALFSGSLYLLLFTDVRALALLTPIGGVAFIVGWATLALALAKHS